MEHHQLPSFSSIPECRKHANELLVTQPEHFVAKHLLAWCSVTEGDTPNDLLDHLLRTTSSSKGVPLDANLGWLLTTCMRSREAINRIYQDLEHSPDSEMLKVFAGISLYRAKDFSTAKYVMGKILERNPKNKVARFYHASALMNLGNWEEGFIEMDRARSRLTPLQAKFFKNGEQLWTGQDLLGKHIVIVGNGNPGDQIQFARYTYELSRLRPGKIGMVCEPEMIGLMRSLKEINRVDSSLFTPFDYFIPMESLPYQFDTTSDSNFGPFPYLGCIEQKVNVKKNRLNRGRPLLGLSWKSNDLGVRDPSGTNYEKRARSLDLESLKTLLSELAHDYDFVVFERNLNPEEKSLVQSFDAQLIPADDLSDYLTLAEWLSAMDQIVSVDTPIAHLAGALGHQHTSVLLPFTPDWRWADNWYPDSHLYMKTTESDWTECVAQLTGDLQISVPGSAKMAS